MRRPKWEWLKFAATRLGGLAVDFLALLVSYFASILLRFDLQAPRWGWRSTLLAFISVGVKNGARTFGYVIGIRAISTSQFVKAGVVELPFKFVTGVAEKIATQVKGANRVVWDVTPKPPATIEWE